MSGWMLLTVFHTRILNMHQYTKNYPSTMRGNRGNLFDVEEHSSQCTRCGILKVITSGS